MNRKDWLRLNYPMIVKLSENTGVQPQVIATMAILESSKNGQVGASYLAKRFNNYFGIKAPKGYRGITAALVTREVQNGKSIYLPQNFKVYSSLPESIQDFIRLVQVRYRNSLNLSPLDQLQAIFKGGYATDPNYFRKSRAIMETVFDYQTEPTHLINFIAAIAAGLLFSKI